MPYCTLGSLNTTTFWRNIESSIRITRGSIAEIIETGITGLTDIIGLTRIKRIRKKKLTEIRIGIKIT